MPDYTTPVTLYHTADRKAVVEEGDERAAFLIVRSGGSIPEAEARAMGILGQLEQRTPQDAVQRERDAIAAAKKRGAFEEAAIRERNLSRLEMEAEAAAELEARNASGKPAAKAVAEPPENKAVAEPRGRK